MSELVETVLPSQQSNNNVIVEISPSVNTNNSNSKVLNTINNAEKPNDLNVDLTNVNKIVDCIVDLLDGRKLTNSMIIRVVANCMKIAAQMKVSNNIKKKIVVAGIEKFIKDKAGLNEVEINTVMALVDVLISDAIDTLFDVYNGKLSFKKACCFCF